MVIPALGAATRSASFTSFPSSWVPLVRAIAWPAVVLILVGLLVVTKTGRRMLTSVTGRVRGVKVGSVEVDLTPEGAGRAKATLDETFSGFRSAINSEFDRAVYTYGIDRRLQTLLERILQPDLDRYWRAQGTESRSFRSTIHVPDLLFDGALYQLLDYYPSGGGGGRAFGIRFGAIGIAWRLGKDRYTGEAPTNSEQLIQDWGMTQQEASGNRGGGRQSFACIVLRHGGNRMAQLPPASTRSTRLLERLLRVRQTQAAVERPVGSDISEDVGEQVALLYLDAEDANAFGPPTGGAGLPHMLERLKSAATESGLVADLADMGRHLRERGPSVRIFQ